MTEIRTSSTRTTLRHKGSCLCGEIQYEVGEIEPRMGHCHCRMCRKFHGAGFATFGEAKADQFRWISGNNLLKEFVAANGSTRQFCSRCGSSLTFEAKDNLEGLVEFALATLDTPIDARPDAHVFTEFKAEWIEICDQLPKFRHGRKSAKT